MLHEKCHVITDLTHCYVTYHHWDIMSLQILYAIGHVTLQILCQSATLSRVMTCHMSYVIADNVVCRDRCAICHHRHALSHHRSVIWLYDFWRTSSMIITYAYILHNHRYIKCHVIKDTPLCQQTCDMLYYHRHTGDIHHHERAVAHNGAVICN